MQSNDETKVSSKFASSKLKQKAKAKSFCVHFKWPDLGPPTGGCPNQIVLVERSPARLLSVSTLYDSQFYHMKKIILADLNTCCNHTL